MGATTLPDRGGLAVPRLR